MSTSLIHIIIIIIRALHRKKKHSQRRVELFLLLFGFSWKHKHFLVFSSFFNSSFVVVPRKTHYIKFHNNALLCYITMISKPSFELYAKISPNLLSMRWLKRERLEQCMNVMILYFEWKGLMLLSLLWNGINWL
jgi:hypothetical protein